MSLAPRTKFFPTEAECSARDHERRILGVPDLHPLNALNTTRPDLPPTGDRPYGSMQWEAYRKGEYADCGKPGVEGRGETRVPYRASIPLDAGGAPVMHDRFLARISAAGNQSRPPRPRAWLTVPEVAYLCGLSTVAIRDCIAKGFLHAPRTASGDSGHYRVSMAAFEMWYRARGHTDGEVAALLAEARALVVTE